MKSVVNTVTSPTRAEVLDKLGELVSGNLTREQASEWAGRWLNADSEPASQVRVLDMAAWRALTTLAGADSFGGDRPYLYNADDFRSWADELRRAPLAR